MNERGEEVTPLCIHRAPLGTHERFIGFLIEHYNADFPLWLAPVQVAILTVSEKVENYAKSVQSNLQNVDIRVDLDDRPDKIGAKIRRAELSKINIMLIIGEQEAKGNTVSVRRRFEGDIGSMNVDNLTSKLVEEINQRRNTYRKEG